MSGIEQLVINIEHDIDEQYQYRPGEVIRGQIVITTRRKITLTSITIHIKGEGVVAWDDSESRLTYNTNEVYINAAKQIPESLDVPLDKGQHSFNFGYELPDNLPSSYIGKYGSVTYVLKATAVGERWTDTTITSEPFLVLRHTVLPENCDKRIAVETQRKIYGTCSFGKVKVVAAVHRIGILPGQDLFVDAEIKNKCPRMITAVQAALMMDTRYHAHKVVNNFRQVINRRRDEVELLKNEGRRWQNVRLAVPPYIPESKLDFCDIIDIDYLFQLRVEVVGGKDITLEVPITIASHQNAQPKTESMMVYDLDNSNSTWTDLTLKKLKNNLKSVDLEVPNGDAESPEKEDWHGFTMPEMRTDTNIMNPLYDKEVQRPPSGVGEMTEVIESTKL